MISKTLQWLVFVVFVILAACTVIDEVEPILVVADFNIAVSSDNAPAEVTIANNSTGATSYSWSFVGGDVTSSADENPSPVNYADIGDYTIVLEASNGTDTKSVSKDFSLKADSVVIVTESLTPSENDGVDAFVSDYEPDRNFGTHPSFMASAWTVQGTAANVRSFIKFDFSSIPQDAIIESVKLSLYSYDSQSNGSHSVTDKSNECVLQKVDATWSEDMITWNNQPASSTENEVVLVASTAAIQDYLDIDVTALVSGMISDPATNHGLVIKQVTEEYYSRLLFGSSDNNDSALHPKLEIKYQN